jgi:hypothetical protein
MYGFYGFYGKSIPSAFDVAIDLTTGKSSDRACQHWLTKRKHALKKMWASGLLTAKRRKYEQLANMYAARHRACVLAGKTGAKLKLKKGKRTAATSLLTPAAQALLRQQGIATKAVLAQKRRQGHPRRPPMPPPRKSFQPSPLTPGLPPGQRPPRRPGMPQMAPGPMPMDTMPGESPEMLPPGGGMQPSLPPRPRRDDGPGEEGQFQPAVAEEAEMGAAGGRKIPLWGWGLLAAAVVGGAYYWKKRKGGGGLPKLPTFRLPRRATTASV